MSPHERQSLMLLEPELRHVRIARETPRRVLSPMLERAMLLLRAYVVVSVVVVIAVLVRGVH
jgi:hypothetical protein